MVAVVLACLGGGLRVSGALPIVPSTLLLGSSPYERASPDVSVCVCVCVCVCQVCVRVKCECVSSWYDIVCG